MTAPEHPGVAFDRSCYAGGSWESDGGHAVYTDVTLDVLVIYALTGARQGGKAEYG